MKPALFEYVAPQSIEEALEVLAADEMARPLAGGQSLIPTMNFRIAAPTKLVDLARIDVLKGYAIEGDDIRVGAMTRQRDLERDGGVRRANPLIAEVLGNVAHIVIRNRGTVGGSIAHADAAAELPCMLIATGGSVVARSLGGERIITADELFLFHMTTALEASELLTEVRIPALPPDTGYAFQEIARRHGDYALAGICALVTLKDGVCSAVRLAACGVASKPTRLAEAESVLLGQPPDGDALEAAAEAARQYSTTGDDRQASADYRKDLVAALVRRTVTKAAGRARERA
ncbi:MAG: xanthine dehydrogenase family protein subunit M [Rhodospirillaceae bacterium]|nr:xanthine dehydrogenase family protein subunit M [Rhodospirillaceae bacterium]